MFDLRTLEPDHKEALDKITILLQKFITRQQLLRLAIKNEYTIDSPDPLNEKTSNKMIISLIQWIRYWLIGNSISEIGIKTNHIFSEWKFHPSVANSIYPFAQDTLNIPDNKLYTYNNHIVPHISYRNLTLIIIDNYFPKQHKSIFDIDKDYGTIVLDNIRESILKYIGE